MKISEIKNKELRELAELRRIECSGRDDDDLSKAFMWNLTLEGFDFWGAVDNGEITEMPEKHNEISELVNIMEEAINKLKKLI